MRNQRIGVILAWIAVGVLVWAGTAAGQSTGTQEAAKPAVAAEQAPAPAAESGKATAKKAGGRMPMFFAQIGLEETQRTKIQSIQAEYSAKIQYMEEQMAALVRERDAKLVAVLTPEQQKKLEELKSAVKASRTGKRATNSSPPAENKPETK